MKQLTLLLLLIAAPASAADVNLILSGGKYYLVTKDSSGAPTIDRSVSVNVMVLDGVTPIPNPVPVPVPANLTERAREVRDVATRVTDPKRAETANDLATLYREIAKKVRSGEVKGQSNISKVVSMATDKVLEANPAKDAWKTVRGTISFFWVRQVQDGDSDAAFATLLDEVADGLTASAPNALPQLDIAKIIEIIKLVMELLKLIPHEAGSAGGGVQ